MKFGADIDRMTAYCTYCPKMCRFSCPTADAESRETATPWGMMRLLELAKDNSVALDHEVADAFYHCTGCRRCQTYCEHDNDVPRALWKARRWSVDSGFLPEAYLDLQQRFDESGTPYGKPERRIDDTVFDEQAKIAFWPDCSTVANHPDLVESVGRLLNRLLGSKVQLVRSEEFNHPTCCGFPLTGAGIKTPESCRDDLWPDLDGIDTVYTDCPGLAAWHHDASSWPIAERNTDPEFGHIFELIADKCRTVPPEKTLQLDDRLLHESCYVTRQIDGSDAVGTILAAIQQNPPQQMAYTGDDSQCCGGRCHYQVLEPEASEHAAEKVLDALDRKPAADTMVTTSSMCRDAMADAGGDEQVTNLLQLICEAYGV